MAVSDTDIAFARELFADLAPLTVRKMFGGASLYSDGIIFAIVDAEGTVFIKAKGALAQALIDDGGVPFAFTRPSDGRVMTMGYVSLPEAALDAPDEACQWARRAIQEGT